MTDTASSTKRPPMIASTNSCLVMTLIVPSAAPIDNDPVSPMKTIAGGALNQRKPRLAPTIEPISQVYSIGGADDHKRAERHKEPAEIEQHIFEKRHCERGGEGWRG